MRFKNKRKWPAIFLTLALVMSLMPAAMAEGSMTINPSNIVMNVNEEQQLQAENVPDSTTVSWSSSNPDIATVDRDGKVIAISDGDITITATAISTATPAAANITATCAVSVNAPKTETVTNVRISSSTLSLKVGETADLTASVEPDTITNKAISWSNSKPAVATFANGKVVAVSAGSTTITATSDADSKQKATCEVTVAAADVQTSISLDKVKLSVPLGGSNTITARVDPSGQTVTWKTDNAAIVSLDSTSGTTVTVRPGRTASVGTATTITATLADGKSATCVATVSAAGLSLSQTSLSLNANGSATLSVNGIPSGSTSNVTWSSNNTNVATVTYSGTSTTVTAKGVNGTAVVTALATVNGTQTTLSCTVTVNYGGLTAISYSVASGEAVVFNADHFDKAMKNNTGYSLNYVQFTLPATNRGTLYYNYNTSSGNYDSKVSASTRYYLDSSPYLSSVSFLAAAGYTGDTEVAYTAVDVRGNTRSGTVTITVSQTQAKVSYSTEKDKSLTFSASDFDAACKTRTGSHLDYVKFTLPSSSRAVLYLDYGASGEKKVSSSTSYYRSSDPNLSDITLVPASGYTGTFTISFTGRSDNNDSFSGVVRVAVGTGVGSVNYTVTNGGVANFDDASFNDFCKNETSYSLDYVRFTLPPSSQGVLYYKYSTSSGNYDSKVSASTSYYRTSSPDLEDVTFVPEPGYSGTVLIDFTGRSTNGGSFSGTVAIKVNSVTEPTVISYATGTAPIRFDSSSFTSACKARGGSELTTVRLPAADATAGRLYIDYRGPSDRGVQITSATSFGGGTYSLSDLSRVTFVPKYGYGGKYTLSYTGVDASKLEYTGTVTLTVTLPTGSQKFSDMGSYGWAAASADYLYDNGITTGVTAGQYGPASLITRGDFVLMLYRAFALPAGTGAGFTDVPADSYYAAAVAAAQSLNIAQGSGGKFSPLAPLTRQDAMVFLQRTLGAVGRGLAGGSASALSGFSDSGDVSVYAQSAVAALVQAGVIQGDNGGKLNPLGSLSRAEMAVILHRALTL